MIYINKIQKIPIYVFALFLFGFLLTSTSYASSNLSDSMILDANKIKISITNDQTGETTVLDPIETQNNIKINSVDTKSSIKNNSSKFNDDSVVVGYDVFIPIENSNSSGITPMDSSGGSKTSGGVTATLNVDYSLRTNNNQQEIRLNKVYGSWTPSANMYYLSNRKVDAHSGSVWGSSISRIPTSNSFTYNTGFGYNYYATGQASPRAWSSAKVHISGMTATHTINLEFAYP